MSLQHTKDTIEKYQKRIQIMQAYLDGEHIEYQTSDKKWYTASTPVWNWESKDYRVAKILDNIDWSQVNPKYRFMARDPNQKTYLYTNHPISDCDRWVCGIGECTNAEAFNSLRIGNMSWEDSLIERPGYLIR